MVKENRELIGELMRFLELKFQVLLFLNLVVLIRFLFKSVKTPIKLFNYA